MFLITKLKRMLSNSYKKIVHFPFVLYSYKEKHSFSSQRPCNGAGRWMNCSRGRTQLMRLWESSQDRLIETWKKNISVFSSLAEPVQPCLLHILFKVINQAVQYMNMDRCPDFNLNVQYLFSGDSDNWLYFHY